jgi:nucleotide-binding universal stress UspA family protein
VSNSKTDAPAIRRILVALDASPHSYSALQIAAELADRLDAELTGLFVEDINLLRVAELPFARELSFYSSSRRRLELREIQRQLRIRAGQLREALASVAARRGIPWHFRLARGVVPTEVLSASAEADLIIMGKVGWSLTPRRRVGSTVRMLLLEGRGLTMVLQHDSILTVPVIAVFDGTRAARKGLGAAGHLARAKKGSLYVIVVADDESTARKLKKEAEQHLAKLDLKAGFRLVIQPSLIDLARLIRQEGKGPVVLPCGSDLPGAESVSDLVNELPNPMLLVR